MAVEGFDAATTDYEVGIEGDYADISADDIEVLTNANGAKVFVDVADIDEVGAGSVATITVLSADLKNSSTYTVSTFTEDYLTEPIKSAIRKYSLNLVNRDSVIASSKLKEKAGIIGACMLARSRMFEH